MDPSGSSASTAVNDCNDRRRQTEPTGNGGPVPHRRPRQRHGRRIGLVASTGSDPFSKAVTDSVEAQATAAGAEIISCDPGANATMVLDCASRLATQHVDGWIIVHTGDVGEALCAAGPQDVPLIAIAAAPVSCETAEVGADDREAGLLTGTELGRTSRLRAGCPDDILIIVADGATDTASTQRTAGIRGRHHRPMPCAADRPGPAGRRHAGNRLPAFTNALTALPDDADILVAAVDDAAALGVAAAIPDARAGNITLAAIGADQRARCEIIANPQWIGDAALFPDRYGEVAVPALLDALQGRQIPANMFIGSALSHG